MRAVGLVVLTAAWAASAAAAQHLPADTLPPVTVSVTRAELPLARLPFAVAVVQKQDFAPGRPTWGLDEALAGVPGVYAANRYNFSLDQRLSIRGFGSRSAFGVRGLKILIDGIPVNQPGGAYDLSHLPTDNLSRVEIVRGPQSAVFGSDAITGVVQVFTRPGSGPPEFEYSAEGGTFSGSLPSAISSNRTRP